MDNYGIKNVVLTHRATNNIVILRLPGAIYFQQFNKGPDCNFSLEHEEHNLGA